jgi:FdhD protein
MQVDVSHWQAQTDQRRTELLAMEEPLELQISQRQLATIMRTPGHDFELAAGFLLAERLIERASDILGLEYAEDEDGLPLANVVRIHLREGMGSERIFERRFTVSSSCGLCGKTSIDDLLCSVPSLSLEGPRINVDTFYRLTTILREQQAVFESTGGLHAAALFSRVGELQLLREDIGRHNAIDKLIGHHLIEGSFPCSENILLVSGRASFEIIQKALVARVPCVAAISAPSSLAVELAARAGITLVGFLREQSMNVYTCPERIRS